jgi:L-lactate dehydrogenase complex protein LldG
MSSSREEILQSLRRNRPAPVERPALGYSWTTYQDPLAKFTEVLGLVGGQTIFADSVDHLNQQLATLPQIAGAQKIASCVAGVSAANVDLTAIESPHALADIDVAILPGEFAVAENAAVWVTDGQVPLRVLFFLCQHLVLVVPRGAIEDHMHAAYERIGRGMGESDSQPSMRSSGFAQPSFGAFISGPSKTADIEQCLVIGAHGPRSLVVCFIGE